MSEPVEPSTPTADDAVARMMSAAPAAHELDLSIGEPDEPLAAELVAVAVESLRAGRTGYTPKLGMRELRELIADDLSASTGVRAHVDDVVVTVGGTGAVAVALAAIGAHGGIIIPDPAWPNYRVLADQLGIEVSFYPQGVSGDDFFDLGAIRTALEAGAAGVVVNSPSNPTGAVASAQAFERLAALVREFDAVILSDEAYESVLLGGGRAPSPITAAPERTFVARTFSKTYSMTGLRVGSLVAPTGYRTAVAALHGTTAGCAPITAQLVAAAALRSGVDRAGALADRYRRRFRVAESIVGDWMPVRAIDTLGGFYLWLDARPSGRSGAEVAARLRECGILVSTGGVYSRADDHIRVALTADDAALAKALEIVAEELAPPG